MTLDDVLIVGGSVAGSATAVALAERGLTVRVVEKSHFPREKPCGEGIMPAGVVALEALGVVDELRANGAQPLRGIAFHHGRRRAEGRFDGARAGLSVRRIVLDGVLARRMARAGATREEGVELHSLRREGQVWVARCGERELRARFLVGADGAHSWVRRQLGLDAGHHGLMRYGVRQHHRLPRQGHDGFVHVHFLVGAELYLTPSGPDCVNVACLLDKRGMARMRGRLDEGYRELVAQVDEVRALLDGSEPIGEVRACGPLRVEPAGIVADGAVLVGDAAGYVDAITGEGVSIALRTAPVAARVIAAALERRRTEAGALREYVDERAAMIRGHEQLTRLLLAVSRNGLLVNAMVRALERRPAAFDRLLMHNDDGDTLLTTVRSMAPTLL